MGDTRASWSQESRWFDSLKSSCDIQSNRQNSKLTPWMMGIVATLACCVALSGCGGIVPNTSGATSSIGNVVASPNSVEFGTVNDGDSGNSQVVVTNQGVEAVQISQLTVSDSTFSVDGQGNLPVSLAAGSTLNLKVHFKPNSDGDSSGQLTVTTNSTSTPTASVKLHGTGHRGTSTTQPTLSSLTCNSASMTAAGTDACTVTLSAAAPSGMSVTLSSNNSVVTMPASVSVPASASTVGFTANVASFTSSQTATLTASAGGVSKSVSLQLTAPAGTPTGTATLGINATSVSFGNVIINTPATQPVTLSSTGTAAVTVNSATVSGSGFTVSGPIPATLNPGQSVTLNVQFDPSSTGPTTGQLTIKSNSSSNSTAVLNMSGTGEPHEVALNWTAPGSSSDPVAGYNLYRAPAGSSSYQLVNSSMDTQTTYTDNSVQSGKGYSYVVKSVDSAGDESAASNSINVTIP